MYGWIHSAIYQLVMRKYGKVVWDKILSVAKFEPGTENRINHYYQDEETFRLVNSVASVLALPVNEIWEAYGIFLNQWTMEAGWEELYRAMAGDLKMFLDNMDALHYFVDHVVYKTQLKGPSFRTDAHEDGTISLHYYSKRSGLYPIVKGLVKEIARVIFDVDVNVSLVERTQEFLEPENETEEHVVFKVAEIVKEGKKATGISCYSLNLGPEIYDAPLRLSLKDMMTICPYHICLTRELVIEHCGNSIRKVYPFIKPKETKLTEIADMVHPNMTMSYANFTRCINGTFIMKMKYFASADSTKPDRAVKLKGQMVLLENPKYILYVCSPYVTTVGELLDRKLHLSDIPLHDPTRDVILLNQSRISEVEMNRKLEKFSKELKQMASDLEVEKVKNDNLLSELLPASVAHDLRHGNVVQAGDFPEATILFCDIGGLFPDICSNCTPFEIVELLNNMYRRFDRLTGINEVYKVETVGDNYMVVGGVPEKCDNHTERICNLALGMLWEGRKVFSPITGTPLEMRIGIHTGPIVAGVVGQKMPRYCLFGDTVNTASRMESTGVAKKIQMSEAAFKSIEKQPDVFQIEKRGVIEVKGKGQMTTYFLLKNKQKPIWELLQFDNTSEFDDEFAKKSHTSSVAEDGKEELVLICPMARGFSRNIQPLPDIPGRVDVEQTKKPQVHNSVSCCLL